MFQPFGSRMGPSNWGRVVTFLQFLSRELLLVATGTFVCDVFLLGAIQIGHERLSGLRETLPRIRVPHIAEEGPSTIYGNGTDWRCRVAARVLCPCIYR